MEGLVIKGNNIMIRNALVLTNVPMAYQARLVAELQKIISSRQIRQNLLVQGWRVEDYSPKSLAERIKLDSAVNKELIARNQIQAN